MARSDPQLNFRIPAELRDKLDAAAKDNNRSLTGELIARLQSTFDAAGSAFPFAIEQAIEDEQRERGGTREEALARLVLAGQAHGGTVLHLVVSKGVSVKEVNEALSSAAKVIPPGASIIFESR